MSPEKVTVFDENRVREIIVDAQMALKNVRETKGRWEDGTTGELSDADWARGTVVVAEALQCFLYPNIRVKDHFGSLKLSEKDLEEDIGKLIEFANSGLYHGLPYVTTEASFTDTAAILLSTFSHIMSRRSAVSEKLKGKYIDEIGNVTRNLIKFLTTATGQPSKGMCAWAPTGVASWSASGLRKGKSMQLDTTYSTSFVLKGLYDAYMLYPGLRDEERGELEVLLRQGVAGLVDLLDSTLGLFSRSKGSAEKNTIHSVFALEGLLYCQRMLDEHEQFKSSISTCASNIVNSIRTDLSNLSDFDQDLAWPYVFGKGKETQLGLMEDRSTIGSIANCLCMTLRYMPPGQALEEVYMTIDALVEEFFRRQNAKTKLWTVRDFRIYYTMRMIESLTNCLLERPEPVRSFSRRNLSQLLSQVLSSDDVVWFITDKLLKQAASLELEEVKEE